MARLGDVCELVNGYAFKPTDWSESGTPIIRIQNLNDETAAFNYFDGTIDEKYIVNTGDLLFAWSGTPGTSFGAFFWTRGRGVLNQHIFNVHPCSKLSKRYFRYALNGNLEKIIAKAHGGVGLQHITKKELVEIDIPVPTIEEQERICAALEQCNSIISLRKQQIAKLDKLVKARFVEMFGRYPENPNGWETATIRDIVTDVRYGSSRPAVDGGKYPYLRMNNITYGGELDLTDTKQIDVPDNELDKCTVRRGDVLFNRTNSKELVGKTCVYNRDEMMVLAGFVIRVRVNERILPEFLSTFLNTDFSKHMLQSMCKTAIGQANINAQEMQDIGIYLPPINLQKAFVTFVAQTDQQKSTIQHSLAQLELLKKALMQKYFG